MSAESTRDYPGNVISPPPVPQEVTVTRYQCPKPGCDTISKTELGIKQHAGQVHGDVLTRYIFRCVTCGETFYVKRGHQDVSRYCSGSCRGKSQSASDDPDILSTPPDPVAVKVKRYQCPIDGCERVFKIERGAQRHVTDMHPGHDGVTVKCERCGEVFHRKSSAASYARFCSEECRDRSRRRRVTLTCAFCGDEFWTHECRKDEARFCSHECHYFGVLAHPIAWLDPGDVGLSKFGEARELRTLTTISIEAMNLE